MRTQEAEIARLNKIISDAASIAQQTMHDLDVPLGEEQKEEPEDRLIRLNNYASAIARDRSLSYRGHMNEQVSSSKRTKDYFFTCSYGGKRTE